MIPAAARALVGGWATAGRALVTEYLGWIYAVIAIAVLLAAGWSVWRVMSWKAGYEAQQAAVAARDAALEELQGYKAAAAAAAVAYTDQIHANEATIAALLIES